MQDDFRITTAQQWKALSHPLRQRILLLVHEKEMTNAQLAEKMAIPSGQLHFHTRTLLSAGLIEIVGTRMKGPITEKLYRATAKHYLTDVPLGGEPHLELHLQMGFDTYSRRGKGANDAPRFGTCVKIAMRREMAEEYRKRLDELNKELVAQANSPAEIDSEEYAFTLVMHRLAPLDVG